MSLLALNEFLGDYGGTTVEHEDQLQLAIDLAEYDIGRALNTFLEPTSDVEEFPWPVNGGRLTLSNRKVTSITLVTAKHSLDSDCVWTTETECGVILNSDMSYIKLQGCNLTCECSNRLYSYADRAEITYVAGYTAVEAASTTAVGKELRMAVALRAREWALALDQADFWSGEYTIRSFSSMDYSEQRHFAEEMNPIGPGAWSQAAWRIVKRLKGYRMVALTSSGRI